MRIVLDTGDLRNLASVARRCADTASNVAADVRQVSRSIALNTRDDAQLRRHRPFDELQVIDSQLRGLENVHRARARRFESRATLIEDLERFRWRPLPLPIHIGLPATWWRSAPRSPLPPVPAYLTPFGRIKPLGIGGVIRSTSLVATRSASLLQQGVGLIGRGIGRLRNRFNDVTKYLRETAADAWNRVWGKTKSTLAAAVNGIKNIAVYSGRVAVDGYNTVVSTVGRWISAAARATWTFLGYTIDLAHSLTIFLGRLKNLVGVASWISNHVAALSAHFRGITNSLLKLKGIKLVVWIPLVIGGLAAVKALNTFGLGDARFWTSAFNAAAPVAIHFLVGAIGGLSAVTAIGVGSAALIVLAGSIYVGTKLSERFFLPGIFRAYDEIDVMNDQQAEYNAHKWHELAVEKWGLDSASSVLPKPATGKSGSVGAFVGKLPGSNRSAEEVSKSYIKNGDLIPTSYRSDRIGDFGYQCTAWAYFRWRELGYGGPVGTGNGGKMAENNGGAPQTIPKLGAMISQDVGEYGHVMIGEEIVPSHDGSIRVRVSEWNVDNDPEIGSPEEYRSSSWLVRYADGSWAKGDKKFGPIVVANIPGQ